MNAIKLDLKKLFGFKIIANEIPSHDNVTIGAKLGEKEGIKTGSVSSVRIAAKIGSKVGVKVPD